MPPEKSDTVTFTPNGLEIGIWDEENLVYVPSIITQTAITYLRKNCEIKGATLRNIMEFVRKDEFLSAFLSAYCWCNTEKWNKCLDLPITGESDETMHFHQLSWVMEIQEDRMEMWANLSMVGEPSEDIKRFHPEAKFDYYGYSSKLQEYLDLPVMMVFDVDIIDWKNKKPYKTPLAKTSYNFTLLEVLDAIYFEITFHGDPEDTESFWGEMKERAEEVKSDIVKAKEVSFENLKETLNDNFQKKYKKDSCPKCEKYEGREMKNFNFKKKTGNICCRECGTVIKEYKGD